MALARSENQRTVLYRFYAAKDQLLYVGITDNPGQRWEAHMRSQPWWAKVQRQTAEWYATRGAAVDAEIAAIREECPLYNKQHAGVVYRDGLALRGEWMCARCGWATRDPAEQLDHLEAEAGLLSARAPEKADSMLREVATARRALGRLTVSCAKALDLLDQANARPARRPRTRPEPLSGHDMQKLLADLDEVMGQKRARLSELPTLLRQHDPAWEPYHRLNGVALRRTLTAHGVRVTNAGNVPRLEPADLRQRVVTSSKRG